MRSVAPRPGPFVGGKDRVALSGMIILRPGFTLHSPADLLKKPKPDSSPGALNPVVLGGAPARGLYKPPRGLTGIRGEDHQAVISQSLLGLPARVN